VVNIQNVVFCIVTVCNFVACTDASKENALISHRNSEDGGTSFLQSTDNSLQGYTVLQPKMLQFGLFSY
jgi:hypothetical protein